MIVTKAEMEMAYAIHSPTGVTERGVDAMAGVWMALVDISDQNARGAALRSYKKGRNAESRLKIAWQIFDGEIRMTEEAR